MIAVYGIRCVENDKYYVGSSTKVKARISTHKRSLRNGVHHSRKLQRAWDKYGEENFVFEIFESDVEQSLLQEREQYWMDKKNSFEMGYNAYPFSTPCPAKEKNGMWGKTSKSKGVPFKGRRPVVSYDLNTGEVEFFDFVSQAMQLTGVGPQFLGCITEEKINKNKNCSFSGKFWFYQEDFSIECLKMRFSYKNRPNPNKGITRSKEVCENISKSRIGMRFSVSHIENMSLVRMGKGAKKIIRSDGKIFNSIKEAAEETGCDRTGISHVLAGDNKTCKGFAFEYINK
jgi:group I intron endonuclease